MDCKKDFKEDCGIVLEKVIAERETGDSFYVPRWVSFVALFSRVIFQPAGLVPGLIVASLVYFFYAPLSYVVFFKIMVAFILMVCFMTGIVARGMASEGVLEMYMTLIYTDKAIPMWLKKTFGKSKGKEI